MFRSILCAAFIFCAAPAFASSPYTADDAFVRETPMKVSAGYIVIKNPLSSDDALIGAEADWAGRIELHNVTANAKGVMEMTPVKEMPLPSKGELNLRPGGYHLMIFDLKHPIKAGETKSITLHFQKLKDMVVPFAVKPITYTGAAKSKDAPKMQMDMHAHH